MAIKICCTRLADLHQQRVDGWLRLEIIRILGSSSLAMKHQVLLVVVLLLPIILLVDDFIVLTSQTNRPADTVVPRLKRRVR